MSGRLFFILGRGLVLLIFMAVFGPLTGCAPKPVAQMSSEDLQICDDSASQWIEPSVPLSDAKPYLVIPAQAEITSPVYASILSFAPVVIQFKQPPGDPGVSYRLLTVIVRTINATYMEWVGNPITVVPPLPTNIEVTWTPPTPGKYLIMVFFSNVETIPALGDNVELMAEELQHMHSGDHYETYKIHNGPSSLAYVCVQIDPLKAVGAQSSQPVVQPLQNNVTLLPSITRTVTPWPTITKTPTLIPSITIPTATFTHVPPTRVPPTRVPPSPVPPTPVPPTPERPTPIPPTPIPGTEVPGCSTYLTADTCNMNPVCTWGHLPTGAEACVNK